MTKSAPKKLPADAATHEALLKELEYLRAENDYLKILQEILTEKKRQEQVKNSGSKTTAPAASSGCFACRC